MYNSYIVAPRDSLCSIKLYVASSWKQMCQILYPYLDKQVRSHSVLHYHHNVIRGLGWLNTSLFTSKKYAVWCYFSNQNTGIY